MSVFERVLGGNVFYEFWKQLQQHIFSEARFIQLITLQPIEIYKASTQLEVDDAKIDLHIKSNVENLMQRRIERTINLLTLNLLENKNKAYIFDFDVIIKAQMAYAEVNKFFNHHFAKQTYVIEENQYYLFIKKFETGNIGTKGEVRLPFMLESKRWFLKRKMHGVAVFNGSINFHQPKYVIKTRNLRYRLETNNWILKIIDRIYHEQIVAFLSDFLQYNFSEELMHAKAEAQAQIDSFQSQTNWIAGQIEEMDMERITIENDGVHAVFLAQGKLRLIP